MRPLVGSVAALGCVLLVAPVAEATFPGANGLLAFSRFGNSQFRTTISLVDPRSGRTRKLTRVPERCRNAVDSWDDLSPSFSPSGRFVVYEHVDSCEQGIASGLYVIRVDGRERRRIAYNATAQFPAFAPSGRSLVFDDRDGGHTLVINIEEPGLGRQLRLPRADYESGYPAWSAAGRLALVVGRSIDANSALGHIATIRPDGTDMRLVTRSVRDIAPDWSPTSDLLAFDRDKGSRSDILVASADATQGDRPRRLTHTRDAFAPVWSPDGRYIAFNHYLLANTSLAIVRARDGGGHRVVAEHLYPGSRISWQPRPRR